jgi:hypothetical protein
MRAKISAIAHWSHDRPVLPEDKRHIGVKLETSPDLLESKRGQMVNSEESLELQ